MTTTSNEVTTAAALDALDKAATQGVWENDPGFQSRSYLRASEGELVASFSHIYDKNPLPAMFNASLCAALVNAYRTGQLVPREKQCLHCDPAAVEGAVEP